MKIALIGSNGLLGSALKSELENLNIDFLALTHENFEITNPKSYSILKGYKASIVINTAAYLGVEPCEKNPIDAFEINTKAVGDIARFCRDENMTLVQISTDGVFDGLHGLYDENSNPSPVNMYGLTKYNAEQLVQSLLMKYYIFRIPILFGKRKNNGSIFIEKMYNLYQNGTKQLKISDDIKSCPSYSIDIAREILTILQNRENFGIYHIYNSGENVSLYDFAVEFFKQKKINDLVIERAKAKDFVTNEIGIKPLDTRISSIKRVGLRDWKAAMEEYCQEM